MRGEDFQFGQIEYIQEGVLELMEFNKFPESLPNDVIIFTMHQGCTFGFMRGSEGCDPPIHFYFEQENGQRLIQWNYFKNLESYLLDYIESLIKFLSKS
jgi:hypothetical protein